MRFRERSSVVAAAITFAGFSVLVNGQTTGGLIRGDVSTAETKIPVSGASVCLASSNLAENGCSATRDISQVIPSEGVFKTQTDSSGVFTLALLPPGTYWLRVVPPQISGLQAAEVHDLVLPVGGSIEQPIELRLLNDIFDQSKLNEVLVPGSDQLVRFYGPDLDLSRVAYVKRWEADIRILEPSISTIIDPTLISTLPFAGRDIYTMLALQPSVTSDSATSRSLGLSANGIRPSAPNYLVDGLEINNYLVGGPAVAIPPEAIQEYSISTNGFSAEYGRTAGYLANAVTHSGGPRWQGMTYLYSENRVLNANDFQNNLVGAPRPSLTQYQAGYSISGPLPTHPKATNVFWSSSGELLHFQGTQTRRGYDVPSAALIASVNSFSPTNPARVILNAYKPPPSQPLPGDPDVGVATLSPPTAEQRYFLLNRLDGKTGSWRSFFRLLNSRINQPDFIWSPYPAFISGLNEGDDSLGMGLVFTPNSTFVTEAKLGISRDSIGWSRSHPEVPTLAVLTDQMGNAPPLLPGSPAAYSYAYKSRTLEANWNSLYSRKRDVIRFGASVLHRGLDTDLPYASSGMFTFSTIASFATGADPLGIRFYTSFDRSLLASNEFSTPQFGRQYEYLQDAAYLQESHSWNRRLLTHFGIRLEHFGSPRNVGANGDDVVKLGAGNNFVQRLSNANIIANTSGSLFSMQPLDVAVRASFALDLSNHETTVSRTVLRGGYGIFYDRPVENAWLDIPNNSFVYPAAGIIVPNDTNFLNKSQVLKSLPFQPVAMDFPQLTTVQPKLPNGYAEDTFLMLQRQFTGHLILDTGLQASLGRRLLAADLINRDSLYNENLPALQYLSSQGDSDYFAWATTLSYHRAHTFLSLAYTWAHAIDNQSDPLAGNFFNLAFAASQTSDPTSIEELIQQRPGFSEEFNSRIDRGNADFDQRRNLTFAFTWELPVLSSTNVFERATRAWRLSVLAALRTGFPFTVIDQVSQPSSGGPLLTRRAVLLDPSSVWFAPPPQIPTGGGVVLLNATAFCREPPEGTCTANTAVMGNTGRNEFSGPGLYSADFSISRDIRASWLGESGRILLRADAFNVFNHADLNQPVSNLTSSQFGNATFGRQGVSIGFPALEPFQEHGRQIQLMLKIEF